MRDRDNGNLRGAWSAVRLTATAIVWLGLLLVLASMLADCAGAATPRPVAARAITYVHSKRARAVEQVAPLGLDQIEAALQRVAGVPVRISCDTRGVPSPIDGHVVGPGADGEVFWNAAGTRIENVLHVTTGTCWDAERSNRAHDPAPGYVSIFDGHRTDEMSGAALLTLLHEAVHVALQSTDEGHVECIAVSNTWPLASLLGHSEWDAGLLYWGTLERHDQHRGDVYRTEC